MGVMSACFKTRHVSIQGKTLESKYCKPYCKACFIRRISVVSNAIQTIDNEMSQLINYCLNCIRRD